MPVHRYHQQALDQILRKALGMKAYKQPAPPIAPLEGAPDADADATVLLTHYRTVQEVLACHRYDDAALVCGWCLADDQQVRPIGTRGEPPKFCSDRCAAAHEAFMVKVMGKGRSKPEAVPDLAATIARRARAKREEAKEKDLSYGSGQTRT